MPVYYSGYIWPAGQPAGCFFYAQISCVHFCAAKDRYLCVAVQSLSSGEKSFLSIPCEITLEDAYIYISNNAKTK